jgi:hypothetical protein
VVWDGIFVAIVLPIPGFKSNSACDRVSLDGDFGYTGWRL